MPLRVYLRSLWARRQFALSVPLGELRAQHMNTVLGNVWYLLNPMLQVGVYFLVFGLLLSTTRGIDNFICFLAIVVFSYGYMQKSIMGCAASIVTNEGLIRSLSFPRAILPLAAVVRETPRVQHLGRPDDGAGAALVTGEPLRPSWLELIVLVPLMGLFSLGVRFVFAR